MESWLTRITEYLLAQSWQIAVLTVAVVAATFFLRNRSAHVRYLLWLVVLAKCLVPSVYTVPLAVLPREESPASAAALPPEGLIAQHRVPEGAVTEPVRPTFRPTETPPAHQVTEKPATYNIRAWLAVGWLAGVLALLAFDLLNALRTQVWLQRQRRTVPVKSRREIRRFLSAHGLKRMPSIWLLDGISQPFVWGLVRGSIYLPCDFADLKDRNRWASLLGHEVSHVMRFDATVNSLQVVAQIVFWFHPFVWWANRKIRAEREKCCDEMTIARLHAVPEHYSEAIVETLAAKHEQVRPVPSLAVAGPAKNIEERIKTMLTPGKRFYQHPGLPTVAIVVLTVFLAVPTTVVLTARAQSQPKTESVRGVPIFGNPTNLGATVNSPVGGWNPHIAPDGLSLYFAAFNRPGGFGNADIWLSERNSKAEPWGTPVNLGPPVNTGHIDGGPCLSMDGLEMYFVSDRPGGSGSRDIWVTRRKTKNSRWGTPVNLGPTINSAAVDNGPSLSGDGLSLYFSDGRWSDPRPGGLGRADIWVTRRKTRNEPWGRPVNLGPMVNTPSDDVSPSISKDGLSLYFASTRGYGYLDIWVTTRKSKDDPWRQRVNLGPMVNTSHSESTPYISSDGSRLYFVSNRPDSRRMEIWHVSLKSKASATKSLHQAAAFGDMDQVKTLLSRGVDLSEKDEQGITALDHAVINGHKEIAEMLIAKGANVNASGGEKGWTPLHRATMGGSLEMVQFLVAQGADVNATNQGGETVLHGVSLRGNKDMVELLIAEGADVQAKGHDGRTALSLAEENKHTEIVQLLRKELAKLARSGEGNALQLAVAAGDINLVKSLISKGADVNAKDKDDRTPLHRACLYGCAKIGEILITKGADINAKEDRDGRTPLHLAAQYGRTDVVKLLIARGADLNALDRYWGGKALECAAYHGHRDTVELLLSKGADIHHKNRSGNTALSDAAYRGHVDVAKLLLAQGAKVDEKSYYDTTPLHRAVGSGHQEMVELLLAHGADIEARRYGETALHIAIKNNKRNMVGFLLAKGLESPPINVGAYSGDLDKLRSLIVQRVDINTRDVSGYTPLHCAVCGNQQDVIEFLIANGANINARDNRGLVALHHASAEGHTETVEFLISKGADVNARCDNGGTPLYWACYEGHTEVAGLLIAEGAQVETKQYGGHTPLQIACRNGHTNVAELLIAKGADLNAKNDKGETALSLAKWRRQAEIVALLRKHGAKE